MAWSPEFCQSKVDAGSLVIFHLMTWQKVGGQTRKYAWYSDRERPALGRQLTLPATGL